MKAFIRDPGNEDNRKAVIQLMKSNTLPDGDSQSKEIQMEPPYYIDYKQMVKQVGSLGEKNTTLRERPSMIIC